MSYEFFCCHCGQQISVVVDFPERTVQCPHCGAQILVPTSNGCGSNYQWTPQPTMRRVEPSEPVPSAFAIGELLQDAWNIGTKCWQPFLIMGAIVGGLTFVTIVGIYISTFFSFILIAATSQPNVDISLGFIIALVGVALTVLLGISLVFVWLYGGQVAYGLAIVRGEQPPVSVLFSGMKYFWNILIVGANITVILLCTYFVIFLLTSILPFFCLVLLTGKPSPVAFVLWMLFSAFGSVAMGIVALFVGAIFCLSNYFVVDRLQGPIEAMKSSYRFVWAHFWKVFGSVLLIIVCMMAANMIPLVGVFLIVPVSHCLYTVLYLKVTGQQHGLSPFIQRTDGDKIEPRREFFEKPALEVKNLDV